MYLHLTTSVRLRYGFYSIAEIFLGISLSWDTGFLNLTEVRRYQAEFLARRLETKNPTICGSPITANPSQSAHANKSSGILTWYPSVPPFGYTLGPTQPCHDCHGTGNLESFGDGGFHSIYVTHTNIFTSHASSISPRPPSSAWERSATTQ